MFGDGLAARFEELGWSDARFCCCRYGSEEHLAGFLKRIFRHSVVNSMGCHDLVTPECPNLPETRRSRFGEELNAEKMKKAIWLRPEAVAQIEFLEWTEADRLRHSKFVALREDKNPRSVIKEEVG